MSELTITNVTLIDGTGGPASPGATVHVSGGTIAGIETTSGATAPDVPHLDGTGRFLVPGLWETHAHICEAGGQLRPPWYGDLSEAAAVVAESMGEYLRYGITTIVDLGGRADMLREARRAQHSGAISGPRVLYCGGHFNWAGGAFLSPWMNRIVGTIGDARDEVDRAVDEEGIDLVKIVYSHGLPADQPRPKLSPEVLREIVGRAHARGIPAAIHADSAEDIIEAVNVGVDSAEHMFHPAGPDWRDKRGRVFEALLKHDAYWPLTVILFEAETHARETTWLHEHGRDAPAERVAEAEFHPQSMWRCFSPQDREDATRRFEAAMETAYAAHQAGVKMTISTDSGVSAIFHGISTHREMELHEQAGVPPMAVLQMATINAARKLRVDDRLGTIEPGKVADMLLLDADPLETVTNLRRIHAVIQSGRVLPTPPATRACGVSLQALTPRNDEHSERTTR